MPVTFPDYVNAIKANFREPIIKVEILDFNENVIGTIENDFISGDLSISSGSGATRNCSLYLENSKGLYIPIPEEQFWINTKIRLWTGLRVNGEDYFVSRGIFVIGEPEINSLLSEKTANISFYDKWSLLDGTLGGELEAEYIIDVGTNVGDAVRAVFLEAGEVKTPIIEPTIYTTPYTIIKNAGETFSSILEELSYMITYECKFDRNGFPRFQPPPDLDKTGSIWDYNTETVNYLGSSRKYSFSEIRNFIKVIGDNVLSEIFSATAQDDNPASPTRISLIGKRTRVIINDLLYNTDLCQQLANYELRQQIALAESVDVQSIPVDLIEGGSIITINDSSVDLYGDRFLVNNVNFPLGNESQMSLNVWKQRSFS